MTLDDAVARWRRERERLTDIDNWIEAGKPEPPSALRSHLDRYARLKKPDANKALKEEREELAKDDFSARVLCFRGVAAGDVLVLATANVRNNGTRQSHQRGTARN